MSNAVAIIHKAEILEKVASGMILREIAPAYGVTKQALHHALKDDPEYGEAKRYQVASMIEEAKEVTWAARDPVDIARAREITKFAFRYAESVDSDRWAPRSQVKVEVTSDRADELRAAKSRLIEGEVIVDNKGDK